MPRDSTLRWVTLLIAAAIFALEYRALFVDRDGVFRIEGEQPYEIEHFASGRSVRQALLMQGAGLQAIEVLVASDHATELPITFKVWRGHPDDTEPPMTIAYEGREVIRVAPGRHWTAFSFPRDSTSNNRWYTFEIAVEPRPEGFESSGMSPTLVASRDNPDRGGALWIGEKREPGSLFIRAERRGPTMYRQFRSQATPHLPGWLQSEAIQWVIFAACHWAFVVYLRAMARQVWRAA